MKQPPPRKPVDAPPGTRWFGGPIEWFSISLGVHGKELVPAEVTRLLGCEPDKWTQKDQPVYRRDGSVARVARGGSWAVESRPGDTDEWDVGEAMLELLRRVPAAPEVWRELGTRFKTSFFVGLRMDSRNQGFEFSPELLGELAARGISAGFDVYHEPAQEPGEAG